MTPEKFIEAIRMVALEAAVDATLDTLKRPPGRRPSESLAQASQWFHHLPREEQIMLEDVLRQAAHHAVFGFLAVLDGVRAVESGPDKGTFKLVFQKGGNAWELNPPDGIPLHDLLNRESDVD